MPAGFPIRNLNIHIPPKKYDYYSLPYSLGNSTNEIVTLIWHEIICTGSRLKSKEYSPMPSPLLVKEYLYQYSVMLRYILHMYRVESCIAKHSYFELEPPQYTSVEDIQSQVYPHIPPYPHIFRQIQIKKIIE